MVGMDQPCPTARRGNIAAFQPLAASHRKNPRNLFGTLPAALTLSAIFRVANRASVAGDGAGPVAITVGGWVMNPQVRALRRASVARKFRRRAGADACWTGKSRRASSRRGVGDAPRISLVRCGFRAPLPTFQVGRCVL